MSANDVSEWSARNKTRMLFGVLFLLFWLALLDFPHYVASAGNDSSWMRCLGHFLTNRAQCGVDYAWTYGPLGYFVQIVYDANLYWWKYAWEIVVKFAFAWILLRWAGLLRDVWLRLTFVVLAFVFLSGTIDTLYLLCLLLLGLLPLRDESCRTPSRLAAGTILLAFLSFTKFTFLLVGAVVWVVVLLTPGLSRRLRTALAMGYPLTLLLVWSLLGQSPANIPAFFSASWEIARGYDGAMVHESDPRTVYVGLADVILFLCLLAGYPLSLLRRRENSLGLALLCIAVFLVWKHGFVRQYTHTPYFFGFLLFAPFAVEGLLGVQTATNRLRIGSMMGVITLCVMARGQIPRPTAWLGRLLTNAVVVLSPTRLERSLDKWQENLADEWDLPEIRRLVGEDSVDLISLSQGVVFLNRLNYHPRPIFQSYSAYTPDLLEWNAAFYRSERAPTFVLCLWLPIDERFPTMEDAPTLLELFRRYRFVIQEKGFLLLKRRSDDSATSAVERPVLMQRTIAFGEDVRLDELGAAPKLISLHIDYTMRGHLTKTLFRSPPVFLDVDTTDGNSHSFRLIPAMAQSDFLVDPLLRDQKDLVALYTGQPLPRVRSLSIRPSSEAQGLFRDRVTFTVWRYEGLPGTASP
jgi:hypothetical protein